MTKLFNQIISGSISKSFVWIFVLTFLLYFFSVRFPLYLYPFPIAIFLIYFFFSPRTQLSIRAITLYIFLLLFAVLLVVSGIYLLDFSIQIKTAIYILFYLIPLTYIFYCEVKKNTLKTTYQNILLSYIVLSIIIFLLYQYGVLAANRYQHVGNILAATSILILGLESKRLRWIMFFLWLFFILIVGSRQALAGLFFCGLVYVLVRSYKVFLGFIFFSGIIYLNLDLILNKIQELAYTYNLSTLIRIIYSINTGGGNSVNTRIKIYTNLVDQVHFFPNLKFLPNNDLLLPHNFFLEYFIVCGYFIGALFFLKIIKIIYKSIFINQYSILVYFSLFYFVTFNVSTGIGAAKYFLYYSFLLMVMNDRRKRINNTIS